MSKYVYHNVAIGTSRMKYPHCIRVDEENELIIMVEQVE